MLGDRQGEVGDLRPPAPGRTAIAQPAGDFLPPCSRIGDRGLIFRRRRRRSLAHPSGRIESLDTWKENRASEGRRGALDSEADCRVGPAGKAEAHLPQVAPRHSLGKAAGRTRRGGGKESKEEKGEGAKRNEAEKEKKAEGG